MPFIKRNSHMFQLSSLDLVKSSDFSDYISSLHFFFARSSRTLLSERHRSNFFWPRCARDMSAASNATVQLPNPYTPMAFFTPDLARDVTIALYVLVGSLAVKFYLFLSIVPRSCGIASRFSFGILSCTYLRTMSS
jgi:hypothetical protein